MLAIVIVVAREEGDDDGALEALVAPLLSDTQGLRLDYARGGGGGHVRVVLSPDRSASIEIVHDDEQNLIAVRAIRGDRLLVVTHGELSEEAAPDVDGYPRALSALPHIAAVALEDANVAVGDGKGVITSSGDNGEGCLVESTMELGDAYLPVRQERRLSCEGMGPQTEVTEFDATFFAQAASATGYADLFAADLVVLWRRWLRDSLFGRAADAWWLPDPPVAGLELADVRVREDIVDLSYSRPDTMYQRVEISQWRLPSDRVLATATERCGAPSRREIRGTELGTVVICAGLSTVIDVVRDDRVISLSAQGSDSGAGEDNPFNSADALLELAAILRPVAGDPDAVTATDPR